MITLFGNVKTNSSRCYGNYFCAFLCDPRKYMYFICTVLLSAYKSNQEIESELSNITIMLNTPVKAMKRSNVIIDIENILLLELND